jgi:hypothetical protein
METVHGMEIPRRDRHHEQGCLQGRWGDRSCGLIITKQSVRDVSGTASKNGHNIASGMAGTTRCTDCTSCRDDLDSNLSTGCHVESLFKLSKLGTFDEMPSTFKAHVTMTSLQSLCLDLKLTSDNSLSLSGRLCAEVAHHHILNHAACDLGGKMLLDNFNVSPTEIQQRHTLNESAL